MKAIQATPKEIRKVFSDSYVIPDFQRPYSWEREHCETLWDDIISFHATSPANEERYFLGNIVVNLTDNGKWSVVDGQQRLTTLILLIKAFFKSAGTYSALGKCLRVLDKRTDELTDELRVKSNVWADDADNLRKIIFDNLEDDNESRLAVNFRYFVEVIEKYRKLTGDSSDALVHLIDTFLDKTVLLPIECGDDDDALTLFQTINDRGMTLTDADIFKARLYHFAPESKRGEFIENWKQLGTPENTERLFRILMHIIRANNGITDKEIGLRKFFTENKSKYLSNWYDVMESLKKIKAAYDNWEEEPKNYGVTYSLWAILETYPNLYWNYPLYVFLHKYGKLTQDGAFSLEDKYCDELEKLLIEEVKYYFIKGAIDNSVNTVKDTTFKVCVAIASKNDYKIEFDANTTSNDKEKMSSLLASGDIGFRYLRGFVVLASYLNPLQDKEKFSNALWQRYDIEHILPKEWNHYDGWTHEEYEVHLNIIGNLMPLEKSKNIKAKNEYLRKKKEIYRTSLFQDAIDMKYMGDNEWTPQAVKDKHMEKVLRLQTFLELK